MVFGLTSTALPSHTFVKIMLARSYTLIQSDLLSMLQRECSLGRVAGPFDEPPFSDFLVSPLGVVPKKEPGKFRLIHDLSFPLDVSVNDFIDPAEARVHYESFDHLVAVRQTAVRRSATWTLSFLWPTKAVSQLGIPKRFFHPQSSLCTGFNSIQ